MNRSLVFAFGLMFVLATLYRIIPYEMRPEGLGAPQLAMALFAGAVVKTRRWAFALPLASMLASDVVMQLLHLQYPTLAPGFYKGQLLNYALILSTTVIGFFVNPRRISQILGGALASPVVYYLLSNFAVWAGGGGLHRPKTLAGLMMTYTDGLPFLRTSLIGTLLFSAVLFGVYQLYTAKSKQVARY